MASPVSPLAAAGRVLAGSRPNSRDGLGVAAGHVLAGSRPNSREELEAAAGRELADSRPSLRDGLESLPKQRSMVSLLATEARIPTQPEGEIDVLRVEVSRLEATLRDRLRPQLAEAFSAVASVSACSERLRKALETLSLQRQEAQEQVGRLTKRQLSEIKQLTRRPPDVIQRTLAACWLVLHCERFSGRSAVQFDDAKDWPRCQRMLADDAFVSRILGFDVALLDDVPVVPQHVASEYLGLFERNASERRASCPAEPWSRRSVSKGILRSSTKGSLTCVKVPLEIEVVTRASDPCGSLFRWLQEVVLEHVERGKVARELKAVEVDLVSAQAQQASLEAETAEVDEALRTLRKRLADREQEIALAAQVADKKLKEAEMAKKQPVAKPPVPTLGQVLDWRKAALEDRLNDLREEAMEKSAANKAAKEQQEAVEVDVLSTLGHVMQNLSRLRVQFAQGKVDVSESVPEHASILPKIAKVLQEHRGKLKLLIEGHRAADEVEGADVERSLAVFKWLVEVGGCPPGMLRIKGRGTADGMGSRAVPVPIQELVATSGPICTALVGTSHKQPGLHFADSQAAVTTESRMILKQMAKCLVEDEYNVCVEGHADKDEPADVALKRATVVRDALVAFGVRRSNLRITSCKSMHPLSRTEPSVNRRVEIHVE